MLKRSNDSVFIDAKSGSVTFREFNRIIETLDISSGDILMVHSRLFSLGRMPAGIGRDEYTDLFIDILLDKVGPSGTLIFPTFTYSTCKSGFFDVNRTVGETGVLSERARNRNGSVRTSHPILSVALLGNRTDLFESASLTTCFGDDSLFDLLHRINSSDADRDKVKFMTIGIEFPPEALTYIHSLEEKMSVPYRYSKSFPCVVKTDNSEFPVDVDFFVRDLSTDVIFNKEACWNILKNQSGVKISGCGDSIVTVIGENTLYESVMTAIKEKSDFLCLGGYKRKLAPGA